MKKVILPATAGFMLLFQTLFLALENKWPELRPLMNIQLLLAWPCFVIAYIEHIKLLKEIHNK